MSKAKEKKSKEKSSGHKHPMDREVFVSFDEKDSLKSFEHFMPIAEAEVAKEDALTFNGDLNLLLPNVNVGLANVEPRFDEIVQKYPQTNVARLRTLPALARAVILSVTIASAPIATAKEIAPKLARLRVLRPLTLMQLELFASEELGLVEPKEVQSIRAGTGPLDEARDAIAIARIFQRDKDKLAGLHPFSTKQIEELRTLGDWLLGQLEPANVKSTQNARSPFAQQRDRLWTLLLRWHDELQRAATAVFPMREVEAKVPSLFGRTVPARPEPAKEPTPAR